MSIFKILKKFTQSENTDIAIKKEETTCSCSSKCDCNTQTVSKESSSKDLNGRACLKVLGSGCAKCHKLFENVNECVQTYNLDYKTRYITDYDDIAEAGIMSTPALMIDDKILSQGKLLSVDEIYALIK